MGGQGAVAFAQHAYDNTRELAVKFFFSEAAFRREAAISDVRARTSSPP
jgi:hypothetical protein